MAADDGFARPLAVAGRSLIANLGPDVRLELYVLDLGLSTASKSAVEKSFVSPQVSLEFIDAVGTVDGLPIPPVMEPITTATYARLLVPELLPGIDRVVYLDSDIVVRRCIADLFEADLSGNVALAVPDAVSTHVSAPPWGLANWFEVGRNAADLNFNAGVLVMDLTIWRRERIGQRALDFIKSDQFWRVVDQEAINLVVGLRIGALDPRWNQQSGVYKDELALFLPYPRSEVERLRQDPWIVHFTGDTKPWAYASDNPWKSEWYQYLDQTEFRGWRPPRIGDPREAPGSAGTGSARPWWLHVSDGSEARMSDRSPDGVRVEIEASGTRLWDVQVNVAQPGIEEGRAYQLRCEVRADRPREAVVGVARFGQDWAGLGLYQTVDLSPRWRRVVQTFRASSATEFSRVHFDLGTNDVPVDIRNVSLRPGRSSGFRRAV
jgi:lipopolysaccharide biosynthesis glycosyltransferase